MGIGSESLGTDTYNLSYTDPVTNHLFKTEHILPQGQNQVFIIKVLSYFTLWERVEPKPFSKSHYVCEWCLSDRTEGWDRLSVQSISDYLTLKIRYQLFFQELSLLLQNLLLIMKEFREWTTYFLHCGQKASHAFSATQISYMSNFNNPGTWNSAKEQMQDYWLTPSLWGSFPIVILYHAFLTKHLVSQLLWGPIHIKKCLITSSICCLVISVCSLTLRALFCLLCAWSTAAMCSQQPPWAQCPTLAISSAAAQVCCYFPTPLPHVIGRATQQVTDQVTHVCLAEPQSREASAATTKR